MKKKIFLGLMGLALTSLTAFNAKAVNVTVEMYQNDGTPLNGGTVLFAANGSTYSFPTGVSNSATRDYTGSYGSFRVSGVWKGTSFTSGYFPMPASDTTIRLYTTGVKFKFTSAGNMNVPNVGFRYTAGGSTTNQQGYSDANGEYAIQVFPGTYSYNLSINNTSKQFTFTAGGIGDGTSATQVENFTISRVNFHNSGTVRYPVQGSADGYIGTNFYMIPGTYNLRFKTGSNPTYSRNVDISGADFNKAASVIVLKDHNGNPTNMNWVRGGITSISWHVSYVNGGKHISDQGNHAWIDIGNYNVNNNRIYEVTKNGTLATLTQDITTNNVFNFQTSLLTLRLQKCNTDGIAGGTIRWGFSATGTPAITSHWRTPDFDVSSNSTDATGNSSMEVFTGNFIFEMKHASSMETRTNVAVSGNHTETWQTTNVKLNYTGAGSSIAYGVGSPGTWWTYPVGGQELLPGTLVFNFKANGNNNVNLTIPAQCTPFEKTIAILRLVNSSNAALSGGIGNFYQGSWQSAYSNTQANGNAVAILNGNQSTATVAMSYLGTGQQKNWVNLASVNHVIVFETELISMTLVDVNNNPIEADANGLSYYAGGWKTFGTGSTSGGSASMELLPQTTGVSFAMVLNGTRQQKSNWDMVANPTVPFQAAAVNINYIGADCNPVSGASTYYYAGSWRTMGTTDGSGNTNVIAMLPGGPYSFSAGSAPQVNGIIIGSGNQTVYITQCTGYARMNTQNQPFSFYPNPATTELIIGVTVDNSTVSILSLDGKVLHSQQYQLGTASINISSLAAGNYILQSRNADKVETFKFIKQ